MKFSEGFLEQLYFGTNLDLWIPDTGLLIQYFKTVCYGFFDIFQPIYILGPILDLESIFFFNFKC